MLKKRHPRRLGDLHGSNRLKISMQLQHKFEWLNDFAEMISTMPEVVEFYRMSGEVDYLLRVVVPDMAAYDTFYRKLIANVQLKDVSSSFAMEEIKYTTALPLPEFADEAQ